MAERRPLVINDGRIEEFPIGDTLPAGLGGGVTAVDSAAYRYTTGGAAPATGRFTMNFDLMSSVTTINIHYVNFDGNDIQTKLDFLIRTGSTMEISKANDPTVSGEYEVVSVVDNVTYMTVTVTLVGSNASGTMSLNDDVFFTVLREGIGGGGGLFNNLAATTAPAVTNDNTESYVVGSMWINVTADVAYICVDASTGAAVWKQIDAVGGGSVDAFYAPASTLTPGSSISVSTSAYGTKGNIHRMLNSALITEVTVELNTVGNTDSFEVVLGVMSGTTAAATISAVAKQAFTGATGVNTITLTVPYEVSRDDILFVGATNLTSGAAADPGIQFYSSATDYSTNATLAEVGSSARGVRFSDADIIAGDSPFDLTTSYWAVAFSYRPMNALLPIGGTAGQKLSKIDGVDFNAEWVDDPSPLITLGTTITASRDLTNGDLAGGVFLDVGHATVPIVINIPLGLTGTQPVTFQQTDVAAVSFTVAVGGTIKSLDSYVTIAGDGASVTLVPKGSDVYGLIGALIA